MKWLFVYLAPLLDVKGLNKEQTESLLKRLQNHDSITSMRAALTQPALKVDEGPQQRKGRTGGLL